MCVSVRACLYARNKQQPLVGMWKISGTSYLGYPTFVIRFGEILY